MIESQAKKVLKLLAFQLCKKVWKIYERTIIINNFKVNGSNWNCKKFNYIKNFWFEEFDKLISDKVIWSKLQDWLV